MTQIMPSIQMTDTGNSRYDPADNENDNKETAVPTDYNIAVPLWSLAPPDGDASEQHILNSCSAIMTVGSTHQHVHAQGEK